jgi:flagellar biosynthetic protein FliR
MEFMISKLLGFVLVLTRMSAFFLVAPVFSWQTVPVRFRVTFVLLISIFFSTMLDSPAATDEIVSLKAILMISSEAVYGFALGLIAVVIFSAVKVTGRIIERQMGMAMAETLDPLSGDRAQPLGLLIEMIFILLFLSANGHHLFMIIISRSYESFPSGTIPSIPILLEGVVRSGTTMLIVSLRLAAPMLAAFLLLLAVLGVFARIMPDMNILFLSMPLRVGMGLLMMGIFLPFINQFIGEFAKLMGKLLPL